MQFIKNEYTHILKDSFIESLVNIKDLDILITSVEIDSKGYDGFPQRNELEIRYCILSGFEVDGIPLKNESICYNYDLLQYANGIIINANPENIDITPISIKTEKEIKYRANEYKPYPETRKPERECQYIVYDDLEIYPLLSMAISFKDSIDVNGKFVLSESEVKEYLTGFCFKGSVEKNNNSIKITPIEPTGYNEYMRG